MGCSVKVSGVAGLQIGTIRTTEHLNQTTCPAALPECSFNTPKLHSELIHSVLRQCTLALFTLGINMRLG